MTTFKLDAARWLPWLVLAAALYCYWRTACVTLISYSDSAELVAASYTLGIPHAPGYPFYMLLGKAWSLMLTGDVTHRYSLLCGLSGALTVALILIVVKNLTQDVWAAVLAAAGLAGAYHFWLYSLVPEVSSLNSLFAAGTACLVLLPTARPYARRRLLAIAFIYGLSLAHHHTMLLWLPALAYGLREFHGQEKFSGRTWLGAAACFMLGLLPYAYLPAASAFHPAVNAWQDQSLAGFIKFISRRNYGSLLLASEYADFSLAGAASSVGFYFQCLLKNFGWSGILLGLAGLYWLPRRGRPGAWFLLLAFLFSGPGLFAISRMPANTFSEQGVLEKLLGISLVPWAVFMGGGAAWLARAARRLFGGRMAAAAGVYLLLGLLSLQSLAANWPLVDKSRFILSKMYARDLLRCVADQGVVLIHGDTSLFSTRYLQMVEGFRPDVSLVNIDRPQARGILQANFGRRPVYVVGLPGNEFDRLGVNGNPYSLLPRGLVFAVAAAPGYADDSALWAALEFQNQWQVDDFADVYARETLWFYALAHYNKAVTIVRYGRVAEACAEARQALRIDPRFPEARRFLEKWQP